MNKLLLTLALLALPFIAHAQTTTNLAVRWTVETVTAGVTNANNLTVRWDYGNKKEALRIDGLNFAYANYVASVGTNTPATFQFWLRNNYTGFVQGYANQKQQADNVEMLQKLTVLLTSDSDLLTVGELNTLQTISNKAP